LIYFFQFEKKYYSINRRNSFLLENERYIRKREKRILPIFFMGCLFIIINGFALFLSYIFIGAGMEVFEQANDPMNLVWVFITILGMTILILLIGEILEKTTDSTHYIIRGRIHVILYLFSSVFPCYFRLVFHRVFFHYSRQCVLLSPLVKYPEWYIIDLCGIIIARWCRRMFGISLVFCSFSSYLLD